MRSPNTALNLLHTQYIQGTARWPELLELSKEDGEGGKVRVTLKAQDKDLDPTFIGTN